MLRESQSPSHKETFTFTTKMFKVFVLCLIQTKMATWKRAAISYLSGIIEMLWKKEVRAVVVLSEVK